MRSVIDDVEQQQHYWEALVARIAAGEAASREEFRSTYGPGIRFLMQRRIGDEHLDEVVNETVGAILVAISEKRLTTVAEMARFIRKAIPTGRPASSGPVISDEERERAQSRVKTLDEVLEQFNGSEREALVSFYARGFSERDVEAEFGFDRVQFRYLRERLVRSLNSARARRGPAKVSRPVMLRASAAGGAA